MIFMINTTLEPRTEELVTTCKKADIEFMTAPYDIDAVDKLNPYLNAFKVDLEI